MWVAFVFICYLGAALAIPLCLALMPVWRKAAGLQQVSCPAAGTSSMIALDAWYAVRMHAKGDRELRVKDCERWPEACGCRQECLLQIVPAGPAE